MKKIQRYIILLLTIGLATGCVEQYALQSSDFESALVIEATLTNELKTQEVKLSRTFRLEEDGPQPESGAQVSISDDQGDVYNFTEIDGVYRSNEEFSAESGKNYTLEIVTTDGKTYRSHPEMLTTATELDDLVATVGTVQGERGVKINAKAFDPANTSKYYRYVYMETYKIIAPYWSFFRALRLPEGPGIEDDQIQIIPREPGET